MRTRLKQIRLAQPTLLTGIINVFLLLACSSKNTSEQTQKPSPWEQFQPSWVQALTYKLQQDSTNPHLWLQRAEAYYQLGKFAEAERDIQRALTLDSTLAEAYYLWAKIYFETQDFQRALLYLEETHRLNPNLMDAYLLKGRIYFIFQQYDKAKQALFQALNHDKTFAPAFFYLGMIAKEEGDTAKAIQYFMKATEYFPNYFSAYLQIGLLYLAQQDPRALPYLKTAITIDSSAVHAWYALGMYYQQNNQWDSALAIYRHIIEHVDPQFEQAYYNMGYYYFLHDSLQKARRLFYQSTQVNPAYARGYYMMGLCDEYLGDTAQALWAYRQALRLDPNFQLAQSALARLENAISKKQQTHPTL